MSKFATYLCASLCLFSLSDAHADGGYSELLFAEPVLENPQLTPSPIQESISLPIIEQSVTPAASTTPAPVVQKAPEVPFTPFTGKIKGRKVRLRLHPDLDSRIIKELSKSDLVAVIGEKGDFWAVQPPAETKAYIFRSFVLDNVVEGNRVNVRLEPSLDAPIISHLNSGDQIQTSVISAVNNKWLEITPPPKTCFYIAKDFVEFAGGPEIKKQMDKRHATAEQLLDASALLSKAELRKPFDEIEFDRVVNGYNTIINDYSEFSELVEHAKEALGTFQETYLEKRITYLDAQPKTEFASSQLAESPNREWSETLALITDKMKLWEPVEEALYLSWTNINENKSQQDYYEEQKLAAVSITGIVEPYNSPVKSKPGDFILRDNDIPVAYVYSTQVNLQGLVGKRVTLVSSPRPNNNFAFPAYYVLDVQ